MVKKILTAFIFLMGITFGQVSAAVSINEFLANPESPGKEWVEFYNPDGTDITGYFLDDDPSFDDDAGSGAKKSLTSINVSDPTFPFLEFGSFLNNGGDFVVLFSPAGEVMDQYEYSQDPGKDATIGRQPDGTGSFAVLSLATPGGPNAIPVASPTPTPPPSPSASAGQATPTKATYKINEVKNESGETLASAQVYVDDIYVHHYAPETLTFCHECDYNFGSHVIAVKKTGYDDWSETKTLNAGDNFEVNPVMQLISNPTPTPSGRSPTGGAFPSPSPIPVKRIAPILEKQIPASETVMVVLGTASAKVEPDVIEEPMAKTTSPLSPILITLGSFLSFAGVMAFIVVKYRGGL